MPVLFSRVLPRAIRAAFVASAVAATMLVLVGVAQAPRAAAAPPASIDNADRDAVVAATLDAMFSPAADVAWTGDAASCSPGSTSAAHRAQTLDAVNLARALAGLSPVALDDTRTSDAQAEGTIMAAQRNLSHDPLEAGFQCAAALPNGDVAAGQSNLALGVIGRAAVRAYLDDSGSNNAPVGHRRWLLDPRLTAIATGDTPSSNAMVVLPFANGALLPAGHAPISWPTPGFFPGPLVPRSGRWSVTVGDVAGNCGGTACPSFASSTVRYRIDGGSWVDAAVVHREPGAGAALVFNVPAWQQGMANPSTIHDDVTVDVRIEGITNYHLSSYDYQVVISDLVSSQPTVVPPPPPAPPTPPIDRPAVPQPVPVVTQTCVANDGRIEVAVANNTASSNNVLVRFGTLEQPVTLAGHSTTTVVAGSLVDGAIVVEVLRGGAVVLSRPTTIACDVVVPDLVQVSVECVNGDGRIVVNVVNQSAQSRTYTVSIDGQPPVSASVSVGATYLVTADGVRDGQIPVLVQSNDGQPAQQRTAVVACDPVAPAAQEVSAEVTCPTPAGRIIVNLFNPFALARIYILELGARSVGIYMGPGQSTTLSAEGAGNGFIEMRTWVDQVLIDQRTLHLNCGG